MWGPPICYPYRESVIEIWIYKFSEEEGRGWLRRCPSFTQFILNYWMILTTRLSRRPCLRGVDYGRMGMKEEEKAGVQKRRILSADSSPETFGCELSILYILKNCFIWQLIMIILLQTPELRSSPLDYRAGSSGCQDSTREIGLTGWSLNIWHLHWLSSPRDLSSIP